MSQTDYNEMGAAIEGAPYDLSEQEVDSYFAEEELPFGHVVAKGTADNQALLPAASSDPLVGVVRHVHMSEDALGTTGVLAGNMVSVCRKGRLWMVSETAATKGQGCHVRYAGSGAKGAVRNATVSMETIDATAFMRYAESCGVGELVPVDFDFTNSLA